MQLEFPDGVTKVTKVLPSRLCEDDDLADGYKGGLFLICPPKHGLYTQIDSQGIVKKSFYLQITAKD